MLFRSQLLVMKWAPMYAAETGVLMGMLGGDVVEKAEAEVVRRFARNEVKVDNFKCLSRQPRQGHELEERCSSEWTSTCLICSLGAEFEFSNSAIASSADMSWVLIH